MSATFSAIRVSSARRIHLVFYMDTADTASFNVHFLAPVLSRSSRPLMGFSLWPTFVAERKISFCQKRRFSVLRDLACVFLSEYGEQWWKDGSRKNKQNCFTDFQKAAEYLVLEGYTPKEKYPFFQF